jgi:hypothetical protein
MIEANLDIPKRLRSKMFWKKLPKSIDIHGIRVYP